MNKIIFSLMIVLISGQNTLACRVGFFTDESAAFVGKSFDFDIGGGEFLFNPAGLDRRSLSFQASSNSIDWRSKYSSMTFTQLGPGIPFGGMNEKGLVVESLWLESSAFIIDSIQPTTNESQVIQYLLDLAGSVDEAANLLNALQIEKIFAPLHYFVCDPMGDCLVVEVDGRMKKIYRPKESTRKVLENQPFRVADAARDFNPIYRSYRIYAAEKAISIENTFDWLNSVKTLGWTRWQIVYDMRNLSMKVQNQEVSERPTTFLFSNFVNQKQVQIMLHDGQQRAWTNDDTKLSLSKFQQAFPSFKWISLIIQNFINHQNVKSN